MEIKIFYSWQSDLPNNTNRGFIQTALENAAKKIRNDESIKIEPRVDRDTQGVGGSPAIPETILQKIDEADIFVCDVSIINNGSKFRATPNPNVLFELGYALKKLTWDKVIMVCNINFGQINKLPFDLPTRRIIPYCIAATNEDKATERKRLEGSLEGQIRFIIENDNLFVSADKDNAKENTKFSFLSDAEKLAEKREFEVFRAEWLRSAQSVNGVIKSVNEIVSSIHNHFSPGNNFTKAGIHLTPEKYLKVISDQDFGCQLEIVGFDESLAYVRNTSGIRLNITLFRKIAGLPPGYPNTKRIESISLAPDVDINREVIWRDELSENNTYTSEKVVEKFFGMLIEQIKKGKPLNETEAGGRYIVNGQYVNAWGKPIDDDDYEDNGSW